VLWRRSSDTVIILPSNAPDAVTLAATGPELWELLRTPLRVDALIAALAAAHHADRSVVEGEVRPVLARLAELGAIEAVGE
jgi:hypothetical protein